MVLKESTQHHHQQPKLIRCVIHKLRLSKEVLANNNTHRYSALEFAPVSWLLRHPRNE